MKFHARIAMICKAASRKETPRYSSITSAYLDLDARQLVATTGTIMVVHDVSDLIEPSDTSGLIPAVAFADAKKLSMGGKFACRIDTAGRDQITVSVGKGDRYIYDRPTGSFPNYKAVMPQQSSYDHAVVVSLDASLLWDLAQAMGKRDPGDRNTPAVQLHIKLPTEEDEKKGIRFFPIAVTRCGEDRHSKPRPAQVVGVLMPMRYEGRQLVEIARPASETETEISETETEKEKTEVTPA
jgi:hypothetical protein